MPLFDTHIPSISEPFLDQMMSVSGEKTQFSAFRT